MSYPTFNGWTIINPPATPGFKSIVLTMSDAVAEVTSPFSAQSQVQQWPGADRWGAQVEMPPLQDGSIPAWHAWLASLQGKANAFQLGDPTRTAPLVTTVGSTPVCNTSSPSTMNLPASSSLVTRGWQVSVPVVAPGQYLQVGYRLYMALQAASSDSSGNATINIWPSIREQPADATSIVLNACTGLFRLATNLRQLSIDVTQLAAVSFKCEEAR
jgi:hypothetical protein